MEESKAIHRLVEAQDLVGMVEDMLAADMVERLSPSAWSGIRITLRNIRESIGASHAAMATNLVQRAKTAAPQPSRVAEDAPVATEHASASSGPMVVRASATPKSTDDIRINPPLSRRDLKASLERLVDRQ
jgi:hypothetical protein